MAAGEQKLERRRFLQRTLGGAAFVGVGAAIGILAGRGRTDPAGSAPSAASARLGQPNSLNAYDPIDPTRIGYREDRRFEVGMNVPWAVTTSADGGIYVAGDLEVAKYDANLLRQRRYPCSTSPRSATTDVDGLLWVSTRQGVEAFEEDGTRAISWDFPESTGLITSIAVSKTDVFLADATRRIVLRCGRDGGPRGLIGKRDLARGVPGFVVPSPFFDLLLGKDGLLWVVNPGRHRLEAYTFEGDLEASWGRASTAVDGFCGCCNPVNIAQLGDGRFVTCEKGMPRVKIYRPDGVMDAVVGGPDRFRGAASLDAASHRALDVAVDSSGRVIVLDQPGGVVHRMVEAASV